MSRLNPSYEAVELSEDLFSLRLVRSQTKEPLITTSSSYLPAKAFSSARKTRLRRIGLHVFIGIILLAVLIGIFFVVFLFRVGLRTCYVGTYSTFALDSTYGNYALGEAQIIDISFNLFAGRGLQVALGVVAYRVLTDILMRIMELTPVTFELFSAITFQPLGISPVWPIVKAFIGLPGWRPKFVMGWTLFSVLFIIAFSPLLDSMTGYVQNTDTMDKLSDGTFFLDANFNSSASKLTVESQLCIPVDGGGYQWGFSTMWFLINWCLLVIWVIGTYSTWMDAKYKCELQRKGRTVNSYRAVADMAQAMEVV